jgi:hypothetical protein
MEAQLLKAMLENQIDTLEECPSGLEDGLFMVNKKSICALADLVNPSLDKVAQQPIWSRNQKEYKDRRINEYMIYSGIFPGIEERVSKHGNPNCFSPDWISESEIGRILKRIDLGLPLIISNKVMLLCVFAQIENLQKVIDSPYPRPSEKIQYDQALMMFNDRFYELYREIQEVFRKFGRDNGLSLDGFDID